MEVRDVALSMAEESMKVLSVRCLAFVMEVGGVEVDGSGVRVLQEAGI
jgi:hypothetical protein